MFHPFCAHELVDHAFDRDGLLAGDQHLETVIVIEKDVHSRDVSGPRMIVLQGSQQSLHVPRMMIRSFSGALQ